MVRGITNFKKRFQGYEEQYVIIGGTACDLIMENEELPCYSIAQQDSSLSIFNSLFNQFTA